MALTKTVDFKGITVDAAYIRISGLSIHSGNSVISFNVNYMASQYAEPFSTTAESTEYDITGENPIRQAYAYLKGLERFAAAVDC